MVMYKKKFNLNNKTLILTGVNGLLGLEQAKAILEMGGRLFMLDINENGMRDFIKTLPYAQKKRANFEKIDITDEKSIDCFFKSLDKSGVFAMF